MNNPLIPLHLITGHLGAGKTTLIQHFLQKKTKTAGNWLVLVNEFSALGVDGKILAAQLQAADQLLEIPGGCICCTAKIQVQQSLLKALKQRHFERIFVEPTGLGLPQSLLELFLSDEFSKIIEVSTIFCVLAAQSSEIFSEAFHDRLTLADVIVVNQQSQADAETLEKINKHLNALYPPKTIIYTDFANIPLRYLARPPTVIAYDHLSLKQEDNLNAAEKATEKTAEKSEEKAILKTLPHLHAITLPPLPFIPLPWDGVRRVYQCEGALASFSWQWPEKYQFSLSALREWQATLAAYPGLCRAKGIFRLGQSYRLMQWAGQWQEDFIVYRRESIFELIADTAAPWEKWEKALRNCLL